jgi:dihydropteroate synthase
VIEAIRREFNLPISVDTFKPEVARAAVAAGADIVNSIGGFGDPAMRREAADSGAAAVIMHIQGQPRVAHPHPRYDDVVAEVKSFLEDRAAQCVESGIAPNRIILDPGPGFGKTSEHDLALIANIDVLTSLPYPVLLAASRKKFVGDVLNLPVEERLEGSLAAAVWGVLHGVKIVRTHDVRATKRACVMAEAVLHPFTIPESAA